MALRSNVGMLKDLLLKAGVVDEFQMRAALGNLQQWGGRLSGVIVEMGFCDDETMTNALSRALKLPIVQLGMVPRDAALLSKLDVAFCDEHCVFPVRMENRTALVAMSDPTELDTIDALTAKIGARVQVAVASEKEIRAAIAKHYRGAAVPATHERNLARDAHISATGGHIFDFENHPPASIEQPGELPPPQQWMKKPPSANTLLDEVMGASRETQNEGLTADELKRIQIAHDNQLKAGAILKALHALLAEKGYLS